MHGKHTPPQPDLERLVALCCMSAPFPAARSGVPQGQAPRGCIRRAEHHQGLKPSICPGQRTRSRKGDKQEHRAGLLCSSAQALPVLKARGPLHPQPPSTRHEPQQKLPGPTLPSQWRGRCPSLMSAPQDPPGRTQRQAPTEEHAAGSGRDGNGKAGPPSLTEPARPALCEALPGAESFREL